MNKIGKLTMAKGIMDHQILCSQLLALSLILMEAAAERIDSFIEHKYDDKD
jgi:hypothetical protein